MAFTNYYPISAPRKKKKDGGGKSGDKKGLAAKLPGYTGKSIIQSLPGGSTLIYAFEWGTAFTAELRKIIIINLADFLFLTLLGAAARKNPIYFLFRFINNAPKFIFKELIWDGFVQGGLWYRQFGYERHRAVARTEKYLTGEGKVARRMAKSRFGIAQTNDVWIPRENIGIGRFSRPLSPSGIARARRFALIADFINPRNLLSGESFKALGWQSGYWEFDEVAKTSQFVADRAKHLPNFQGLENINFIRNINPTTARKGLAGALGRGVTTIGSWLFSDASTLEKIGWVQSSEPLIKDLIVKNNPFDRIVRGRETFGVLNINNLIANPGRLAQIGRFLSYFNWKSILVFIGTGGGALTSYGWRKEHVLEGPSFNLSGQPYKGLLPDNGRVDLIRNEVTSIEGKLKTVPGEVRGLTKMLPRSGRLAKTLRILHYAHPVQWLSAVQLLGWRAEVVGAHFGPVIALRERPGRFASFARGLYRLNPLHDPGEEYSLRVAIRNLNLGQKVNVDPRLAKFLNEGRQKVSQVTAPIATAIVGTRVAKTWQAFLISPTGKQLAANGALKIIGKILVNPVTKLAARVGLEGLGWAMAPQMQILMYGVRAVRGLRTGLRASISAGRDVLRLQRAGIMPRTAIRYYRFRLSLRTRPLRRRWEEARGNIQNVVRDIRRSFRPTQPSTPTQAAAVQPTARPLVQPAPQPPPSIIQGQVPTHVEDLQSALRSFLSGEEGGAPLAGEKTAQFLGKVGDFFRQKISQLANNVFSPAARKALVEGGKKLLEATVRLGGQALTSMLGGGGVTGGGTLAAGGATTATSLAGTAAGGTAVATTTSAAGTAAGGVFVTTTAAAGTTVVVGGGGTAVAVTSPAWGTALVIGVLLFIVIFVLFFLIPGSFRPTDALESGSAKVILSKSVKVEVNDPNGGGTNYLRKDDLPHTVEYTLSVRNLSDKSILRVRVEDNGIAYTKEDIAPGGYIEVASYGATKTASCTSCPYLDTNRAEGEAFMADGTRVPLSDVGVLIIYDGSAPPAGNPPCGWPAAGMITSIYARDHDGVDIGAATGATVQEIHSPVMGVVSSIYWDAASGGHIKVKGVGLTGGGTVYETEFVHLSLESVSGPAALSLGSQVNLGQTIGVSYIGRLTYSTGTHLHYRVRENGAIVDPQRYLAASKKSLNEWVTIGEGCGRCNAGYTNCH